ncbi:MAG: hypothetical protein WD512_08330, partial [Candidatus Paceibacterota bacterium]
MNKLFLPFIVLITCLFSTIAFAENSKQKFQPSLIGLNHSQKKLFDYLEIERIILEGRHKVPSTEGYKNFSRIYEEYTKLFCYDTVNYKLQS